MSPQFLTVGRAKSNPGRISIQTQEPSPGTNVNCGALGGHPIFNGLAISTIERDKDIQCRAGLSRAVVLEYKAKVEQRVHFPPVRVGTDGETTWLSDEFHRTSGCSLLGRAELFQRGEDAEWDPISSNGAHALHGSQEDLSIAIRRILPHKYAAQRSHRQLAKRLSIPKEILATIANARPRANTRGVSTYMTCVDRTGRRRATLVNQGKK